MWVTTHALTHTHAHRHTQVVTLIFMILGLMWFNVGLMSTLSPSYNSSPRALQQQTHKNHISVLVITTSCCILSLSLHLFAREPLLAQRTRGVLCISALLLWATPLWQSFLSSTHSGFCQHCHCLGGRTVFVLESSPSQCLQEGAVSCHW